MQACDPCHLLVGAPASVLPHENLAASGAGALGVEINSRWVDRPWHCTVCGAWMFQNAAHGDPPNVWRMGRRPHERPLECV